MTRTVHCEVVTESETDDFVRACGASALTLYESTFSVTQVEASLRVQIDPGPCTVTVTLVEGNDNAIPFVITPTDVNRTVSTTITSLKKVTVGCSGGAAGDFCSGSIYVNVHYCKCCQI